MSNRTTTDSSITLCSLVFIVFLILKLAEIGEVATWSWWWVTSPLWLPSLAVLAIFLVILVWKICYLLMLKAYNKKREEPTKIKRTSKFQERLEEMQREAQRRQGNRENNND